MKHNTSQFREKVERLAERYDLGVSNKIVGESVGAVIKLTIDKVRVEVEITAGRCTVIDEEGRRETFKKSSSGWDQRSLEHIEKLLTAYNRLD
ncbi:MAG: hypothetical protein WBC05_04715 [Sedimentisphaerales bacterium]